MDIRDHAAALAFEITDAPKIERAQYDHPGSCTTGCGETLKANGVLVWCGVCGRTVL